MYDVVLAQHQAVQTKEGVKCRNVKLTAALTRSSLSSTAGDAEIDEKLITPWLPISLVFKNPHSGC